MKVSFLVPDIYSPVLGPVTELARHAAKNFDVEIVGPDFGHGICPMYRGTFDYKVVPAPHLYRFPDYFWELGKVVKAVTGDVVVAVKAFADTVPAALKLKKRRGCKVIVYLDEWDGALYYQLSKSERVRRWLHHAHHPMDDVYCPLVEKKIRQADTVLSTSTFLQRKFGGEVLHMGVDTNFFQPQDPKAAASLKQSLGLGSCKAIVFGGVVRPHKGIEHILDALVLLGRRDYRFVIIGPRNEHVEALLAHPAYAPYLVALGSRPKNQMPAHLGMADLIVLPLVDSLLAQSQTPCKIFEAMSMAKPIIASAVSDLPQILDGCGRVVPPGDVRAIADAIREVFEGDGGDALGRAAREKCIRLYSSEVTTRQMARIVESVAA